MSPLDDAKVLTFDLFGTILDLGGSLTPYISEFLETKKADVSPDEFWQQWRYRQRIEQYQDNIVMMGHSGYLSVTRKACVYTLRLNGIETTSKEINTLMEAWQQLAPFPEVVEALQRLKTRYQIVALSNGEPNFFQLLIPIPVISGAPGRRTYL